MASEKRTSLCLESLYFELKALVDILHVSKHFLIVDEQHDSFFLVVWDDGLGCRSGAEI